MRRVSSSLSRKSEKSLPLVQPSVQRGERVSLRILLLRNIPEESGLLRQWNELVSRMDRPEVFYTCEWALAVQSAYHASQKPLLLLGYDGDELVGVASLSTDLSGQNVSFLAGTTADYCDFLSHPDRRTEFVDSVFAELKHMGVRSVVFANLPADSRTSSALRSTGKKYGFHLHLRPAYLCSQVELGCGRQREQLKAALIGKRQLKRCMKAMEREGPVTFDYLREWEQIEPALPNFVDAHVARFQAKHGASFLYAPERRSFMEDLARRSSEAGQMILTILKIGNRPVAWSYGFQFCGSWFLYQTTFDIRCEENSPGYCLLAKILIEACDTSTLRLADLGLGAEAYKEWFANDARQTLYAALTTSSLRHARQVTRYRLVTEIRRFPKLESALRTVRSRFGQ
jgi:CelD/BcsL family acetyltransferase involved in cellulose biosynthesis